MKNLVRALREEKNMTQTELAERSGISLRTVQRIEAGSILKGFTLKAIAHALETDPATLISTDEEKPAVDRAKLINLSALLGLIVPFGGVIFPLILTYKTNDPFNKDLGKNIVSIQIILTVIVSVLMIVSPFIQKVLLIKTPLFLIFLIAFLCVKLLVVIKNGICLNKKEDLCIKLKTRFL